MLKSTIAKLVNHGQRALWAVLLWMPLMALADNTGGNGSGGEGFFGSKSFLGDTVPNVMTMLINLDKNIPYLFTMVGGLSYLFGITLVLGSIWKFKKWGEGASMVAQKDAREPIMHMAVGFLLIFVPSTASSLLLTVYGSDSILSYRPTMPDLPWQYAMDTIIAIVQFVGFVAIVRGLLHLHKAIGGQAQQNMFSKGIIHLVGGVLSMNIVGTKDILYSTLGLSS